MDDKRWPCLRRVLVLAALLVPAAVRADLHTLRDDDLAGVSGQAFFQADKITGTGTQATGTSGITFYKMGLDAQLDFNMNIREMELGR
ncbi:MAG: hypothetical protein K0S16_1708, partial [Moraxellaceae bacterium]|nr:hypothetical protein [Moraxellaceae bacterium]